MLALNLGQDGGRSDFLCHLERQGESKLGRKKTEVIVKRRNKALRNLNGRSALWAVFNTIEVVRILLQRRSHVNLLVTSLSETETLSSWQAGFVLLLCFVEAAVGVLPLPHPTPTSPPPPGPGMRLGAFHSHRSQWPDPECQELISCFSSLGKQPVWWWLLSVACYFIRDLTGTRNGSNIFMIWFSDQRWLGVQRLPPILW